MQCGGSVAHYEAVAIVGDAPSFGGVGEFAEWAKGFFVVDEGFL